jgi:hypothetical protein
LEIPKLTYSIRNWSELYETAETRKLKRMIWVPVPNKHDGRGLRRLMRRDDGVEILGAWILILQVASKMPQRGLLEDQDGPLEPQDIADKTGADVLTITHALSVLSEQSIGWICCDSRMKSCDSRLEWKGREGNYMEGKGREAAAPPAVNITDEESGWTRMMELWSSKASTVPSGIDWQKALQYGWRPLSHSDKLAAVDWLHRNHGPFMGSPKGWLENRGWERVANPNAPTQQRERPKSATDLYLESKIAALKEKL